MARSETLRVYISKEKFLNSFHLTVKNNFGLIFDTINQLPEDGAIDKNVVYKLEKIIQKLVTAANKESSKEKVLNWKILFNQESYIEEESSTGIRKRVYKISEEEIDTVFETIRIMDRNEH